MKTKTKAQEKNLTVREFIEMYKDLDAYIARGGKLLDLPMSDRSAIPRPVDSLIRGRLGKATSARLGRFFKAVSKRAGTDQIVGNVLTEVELQQIWHQTAIPRATVH
jgi:hypothetical protein